MRRPFWDQRGVSADEIDPDRSSSIVDCPRELNQIASQSFSDQRYRRYRNPFICDPDSKFVTNLVDCLYEPGGHRSDLVTCFLRDPVHRVAAAIEQAQTERNRAHVEMLHLGHCDGLKYLGLGVFHKRLRIAKCEMRI